jgi:DNA-binding MarR family transcriptional regulator
MVIREQPCPSLAVACSYCGAKVREPCEGPDGNRLAQSHAIRRTAAARREPKAPQDDATQRLVRAGQLVAMSCAPSAYKLTLRQWALMLMLLDSTRRSVVSLADLVGWSIGVMSENVTALEKIGLVTRTVSPWDRRVSYVTLTPKGLRRVTSARESEPVASLGADE